MQSDATPARRALTRRAFLRQVGAAAGAAVLAACGGSAPDAEAPAAPPDSANAEPTAAPTSAPAVVGGTVELILMYNENEFSDDEIKTFTDANPNIQVKRVLSGDDS